MEISAALFFVSRGCYFFAKVLMVVIVLDVKG